jgi:hypothetical protein
VSSSDQCICRKSGQLQQHYQHRRHHNQAGLDLQTNNNSASATITVVNNRVFDGLQALYAFEEGADTTGRDASGVGAP